MWRALRWLVVLGVIFAAPNAWLRITTPMILPASAPRTEAALIFGALVRDGQISPLHKERLDAGLELRALGKTEVLVPSNAARAARAMAEYLSRQGVPDTAIEIDTSAPSTPDTCETEAARPEPRSVAYISHRFHLPRIRLHCAGLGLDAIYVIADDPGRAIAPLMTRLRVRGYRWARENLLTWAVLLRLYPAS